MGLHWLQLNRPCILEVPQLKDYAGQTLIFRSPALQTRCVTTEVFNHPLVQAYRDQLLLVEVAGNGAVIPPAAAPVVEVAVIAPTPESLSEATPIPVIVEPEPEVIEESVGSEEPTTSEEGSSTPAGDDGKGFEVKRRRR